MIPIVLMVLIWKESESQEVKDFSEAINVIIEHVGTRTPLPLSLMLYFWAHKTVF